MKQICTLELDFKPIQTDKMEYNKTILLATIFGLITNSFFAQKKITYGVGLDIFQTKLNNVDRENFSGYGHSVPGFKQNDRLGFGVNGIAHIPVYKGLGLETGLGLTRYQSQFNFKYYHSFSQQWMDEKFNIGLNYMRIPLNLYYDFSISKKSSIIISGGINFKLLLWADDNFDEIVFEEIGLPNTYKRYQHSILAYNANIAYQYKANNKNSFEIGLNLGKDFNAIAKNNPKYPENFGFYDNLHNATYSQYGISIKYFYTH